MKTIRTLPLFLALLTLGCSSPSHSTVTFRSPRGSELTFEDEEGVTAAHVVFSNSLELEQFASSLEDVEARRSFKGTLRVNELVEEELVPSKSRALLVATKEGVDIDVKGYYRVFEREANPDELSTYAVDISKQQLLRILQGKAITITAEAEDSPVLDLTIGLAGTDPE